MSVAGQPREEALSDRLGTLAEAWTRICSTPLEIERRLAEPSEPKTEERFQGSGATVALYFFEPTLCVLDTSVNNSLALGSKEFIGRIAFATTDASKRTRSGSSKLELTH
jgi:hypothetical protein